MPIPGGLGVPSFEGMNITEFLERYEELGADFGLSEPEAVKRIPQYCKITIEQFIRNLPEYENGVWENFKKVLLKEFKKYNLY